LPHRLLGKDLVHQQCRKSGSPVVFDTTDPADPIAVGDPAPFSLAEGESVAFPNIQPARLGAPDSAAGISQGILDIWLVSDQPPAAQCDFSGEIIAETIPEWDPSDSSPPAPPLRQAYPVKWVGPATVQKQMTKAELIDRIITAPPGNRVELSLTLELKSRQPAACLGRLEGSLQVVGTSTLETKTNTPILNIQYRPQFYIRPLE
jgi:hypothetical protein